MKSCENVSREDDIREKNVVSFSLSLFSWIKKIVLSNTIFFIAFLSIKEIYYRSKKVRHLFIKKFIYIVHIVRLSKRRIWERKYFPWTLFNLSFTDILNNCCFIEKTILIDCYFVCIRWNLQIGKDATLKTFSFTFFEVLFIMLLCRTQRLKIFPCGGKVSENLF